METPAQSMIQTKTRCRVYVVIGRFYSICRNQIDQNRIVCHSTLEDDLGTFINLYHPGLFFFLNIKNRINTFLSDLKVVVSCSRMLNLKMIGTLVMAKTQMIKNVVFSNGCMDWIYYSITFIVSWSRPTHTKLVTVC